MRRKRPRQRQQRNINIGGSASRKYPEMKINKALKTHTNKRMKKVKGRPKKVITCERQKGGCRKGVAKEEMDNSEELYTEQQRWKNGRQERRNA